MGKCRVVLMGLGSFGAQWFEQVLCGCQDIQIAGVVTGNPEKGAWAAKLAGLPDGAVFPELEPALDALKPELLVNVTPPEVHPATTITALKRKVAVLCEKPIAASPEGARQMLAAAKESGTLLAIGENYRYFGAPRRARKILDSGELGRLDSIAVQFRRNLRTPGDFLVKMAHPMLMDVAVHHFDLMRFFTGAEPQAVAAADWSPPGSVYPAGANVQVAVQMAGPVHISLVGGLAQFADDTDWMGSWHFEAEKGSMEMTGSSLEVTTAAGTRSEAVDDRVDSRRRLMLEVVEALETGAVPATAIEDNHRSYSLMLAALQAAESGQRIVLEKG